MVESKYPNRWFGSNPQAIPNQGKQLHPWSKELPKDWRSAMKEHDKTDEITAITAIEDENDG